MLTSNEMGVIGQRHASLLYPPGNIPRYQLDESQIKSGLVTRNTVATPAGNISPVTLHWGTLRLNIIAKLRKRTVMTIAKSDWNIY
jgi:hypothetical protein